MDAANGSFAAEIEGALLRHTLEPWFPRVVDAERGGFLQDFGPDWSPAPARPRSVVYQARMVWVTATLARCRPDLPLPFAEWAERGLEALKRDFVIDDGVVCFWEGRTDETHLYATAFALYATAAVHRATGSADARELGESIVDRLEAVGWDPAARVFREALPARQAPSGSTDLLGVPRGARSSNAQLHLVEAFTEWLRARDDSLVAERLDLTLAWLEDVVGQGGGALVRHYDVSGRPLDSVRSWGHDVEALHLVDDARAVLGLNGTSALERVARLAYARGLDNRFGGMEVGRARWRRDRRKIGWVQAEALTCAARLSARSAGPPEWAPPPRLIWRFIRDRVLDPVHGGWREYLSRRGNPIHPMDKAHPWKACYHELRALLEAGKGQ